MKPILINYTNQPYHVFIDFKGKPKGHQIFEENSINETKLSKHNSWPKRKYK